MTPDTQSVDVLWDLAPMLFGGFIALIIVGVPYLCIRAEQDRWFEREMRRLDRASRRNSDR